MVNDLKIIKELLALAYVAHPITEIERAQMIVDTLIDTQLVTLSDLPPPSFAAPKKHFIDVLRSLQTLTHPPYSVKRQVCPQCDTDAVFITDEVWVCLNGHASGIKIGDTLITNQVWIGALAQTIYFLIAEEPRT